MSIIKNVDWNLRSKPESQRTKKMKWELGSKCKFVILKTRLCLIMDDTIMYVTVMNDEIIEATKK